MTGLTDEEKMIMNPDELTDDLAPFALTDKAHAALAYDEQDPDVRDLDTQLPWEASCG